jgi:hypothetical protein
MKFKFILPLFFHNAVFLCSTRPVKMVDLNLSNYDYPYPVHFITLKVQQQELKMEYMDVVDNYNGKYCFAFMEKINGAYWQTTIAALTKRIPSNRTRPNRFWKINKTRSLSIYFSTTGTKHKTNFRYTRD